MELLSGESLRARSPLERRAACSIMRDIASALALVHSRWLLLQLPISLRNTASASRSDVVRAPLPPPPAPTVACLTQSVDHGARALIGVQWKRGSDSPWTDGKPPDFRLVLIRNIARLRFFFDMSSGRICLVAAVQEKGGELAAPSGGRAAA
jgi:hypothetical protein